MQLRTNFCSTFFHNRVVAMSFVAPSLPHEQRFSLYFDLFFVQLKSSLDYNIESMRNAEAPMGFVSNRHVSILQVASSTYSQGKSRLEVAKRQAVVYSPYESKVKSVMDVKSR
ncbi:hypothetical protein Sjap_017757 [Stephania japonica]|uniref:Uncharacterized protein n=1 Tax=Stephania japonica TaxID=461633 RepID=A0AAP0I6R2_9MAGN